MQAWPRRWPPSASPTASWRSRCPPTSLRPARIAPLPTYLNDTSTTLKLLPRCTPLCSLLCRVDIDVRRGMGRGVSRSFNADQGQGLPQCACPLNIFYDVTDCPALTSIYYSSTTLKLRPCRIPLRSLVRCRVIGALGHVLGRGVGRHLVPNRPPILHIGGHDVRYHCFHRASQARNLQDERQGHGRRESAACYF
jgi:hypothetical protein